MSWRSPRRGSTRVLLGCVVAAVVVPLAAAAASTSSWPFGGHDISNTHSNPAETTISRDNVGQLGVKWTYTTHGDVSAIPAVVGDAVYFPDWGGYLNKVDAKTGAQIW